MSRTVAERTPQGQRQSVQENNYTAHVYNRGGAEQLAGACRTSPARAPVHVRSPSSGGDCGPGVPRPARVLAPHEDPRRVHCQDPAGVVREPRIDLFPGAGDLPAEVSGPAPSGCDHEGAAGAG